MVRDREEELMSPPPPPPPPTPPPDDHHEPTLPRAAEVYASAAANLKAALSTALSLANEAAASADATADPAVVELLQCLSDVPFRIAESSAASVSLAGATGSGRTGTAVPEPHRSIAGMDVISSSQVSGGPSPPDLSPGRRSAARVPLPLLLTRTMASAGGLEGTMGSTGIRGVGSVKLENGTTEVVEVDVSDMLDRWSGMLMEAVQTKMQQQQQQ